MKRLTLALLLVSTSVASHGVGFTHDEMAWMDRQRAVDNTKCCDVTDFHVGRSVTWRMSGASYEVMINGQWYRVPSGRIMRHNPDDPSPFPGEALLFYSVGPVGPVIWCFSPPPLT